MGRVTEDIRRELMAAIRELKDPRVQGGLISVVRVEVTNDLSFCTVYISAMEGLALSLIHISKGREAAFANFGATLCRRLRSWCCGRFRARFCL